MRRRRRPRRGAHSGGLRARRARGGGAGGLPAGPPPLRRARVPVHVGVGPDPARGEWRGKYSISMYTYNVRDSLETIIKPEYPYIYFYFCL